jgi:hypothetical protein
MEYYERYERDRNKLRFENELKKLQLGLEYGARFFLPPDTEIPLEIERLWLDHIQRVEESFKNAGTIPIYDKIGKPAYRTIDEISETEIIPELDRMRNILLKNGIVVESVHEVCDRELYRFITQDIFQQEIYDMPHNTFFCHFIYEEFYDS